MAKNWYPVVDEELCIECGACVEKCSHGVYDKSKAPVPHVIFEEGCVQGCKGCDATCPVGAIQHVGDFSGKACSCGDGGSGCDCGCN